MPDGLGGASGSVARARLRWRLLQLRHRLRPANWRAAVWTARALTRLRADLAAGASTATVMAPPGLPASAGVAVHSVLRRRDATCLERSLVLQRWFAVHGHDYEVVIGVRGDASGFAAHAWLDGYPAHTAESDRFTEMTRLPPAATVR